MNKHLLLTTAVGMILGSAAAFAQSPSGSSSGSSSSTSPATQNSTSSTPSTSTTTTTAPSTTPSPSAQTSPSTSPTVQNQTPSTATGAGTTTSSQSTPSSTTTSQTPASTTTSQTPASSNTSSSSTPAPSQAQTNSTTAPASSATTPSQAQTNNPAPAANQAQQTPNSTNTNSAQTANTNVNVNINDQQRTRISQSVARLNVKPLTNVNFSLSVGTVVPRDVRFQALPADILEVVPQYRGYSFFTVREDIVIVEPSTNKIVTVLPRSGGATAVAPAPSRGKVSFSDRDREVIRKHSSRARPEPRTSGSAVRTELRRGVRVPNTIEIEEFPEDSYRDAPLLRDYRYIRRENRTYVVEPQERTIIEEVD